MTKPLSLITKVHKNQLHSEYPFIWLFELAVPKATSEEAPERYRLTNFTEQIEWGEDSDGEPITYYPAPITHGGVEQGSGGDLPQIEVSIGTGGLYEIAAAMENADGFVGSDGRIAVISALDLDNPVAAIDEEVQVTDSAMDHQSITLKMSAFNVYRLNSPPYLYTKRRCRWVFGSVECGYNLQAVGAGFSTCGRTIEQCTERGDDEENNVNVGTRQHPKRIGLFPGIPRARRR